MKKKAKLFAYIIGTVLLLLHISIINDYSVNWDFHYVFFAGLNHLKRPITEDLTANLPFTEPDPQRAVSIPYGPLQTTVSSYSYVQFFENLKLLPFDSAFNVPAVLFGVLGVVFLYLFLLETTNFATAAVGALFLALYPRYFGDLHTNVKDIPTATLYTLSIWMFWRLVQKRRPIDVLLAVFAFGIAFNFKVNALTIPPLVFLWVLWVLFTKTKSRLLKPLTLTFHALKEIGLYFVLAPLTAFAIWSIFWPAPLDHLVYLFTFFQDSTKNLEVVYFGKWYCSAVNTPWHYPLGFLAIVTPLPILFGAIIGFSLLFYRLIKHDPLASFLLLWLLIPLVRYLSPNIGVIDGIRHFEEVVFPLIAVSAIGVTSVGLWITKHIKKTSVKKVFLVAVASSILVWLVVPIISYHPYQLSYYNELIGGLPGALGNFDIDYWGISQKKAIQWLNENAPYGSRVHVVMSADVAGKYLRPDLRINLNTALYDNADYVVVLNRQSFYYRYYFIYDYILKKQPVYTVSLKNVPFTWVFDTKMDRPVKLAKWWQDEDPCIFQYWK